MAEQEKGRLIGPMQVVQDDNQRRALGDSTNERRVCVEQSELSGLWIALSLGLLGLQQLL